jgi:hypothetical protein
LFVIKPSRRVGIRKEEPERVRITTIITRKPFGFQFKAEDCENYLFTAPCKDGRFSMWSYAKKLGNGRRVEGFQRRPVTLQHSGRYSIMGSVPGRKNLLFYHKEGLLRDGREAE